MRFPFLSTTQYLVVLRAIVGLYMVAHGAMRVYVGTVDDFGGFLGSRGFPLGVWIAWGITLNEIIAGSILASGRFVRVIAGIFVLEHLFGIALVHAPRGWFTVGHQVGGAEYSVLMVVCFLVVASTATRASQPK